MNATGWADCGTTFAGKTEPPNATADVASIAAGDA